MIFALFLTAGLTVHKVADTNGDLPLTVPFLGGVVAEHQAHFNSYSYMVGIADALDKAGVPIYENSRVISVKYGLTFAEHKGLKSPTHSVTNRKKSPHRVITAEGGEIIADHVVLATHLPFMDRTGHFTVNSPSRSYCIAATLSDPSTMIKGPTTSIPHRGLAPSLTYSMAWCVRRDVYVSHPASYTVAASL